MDKLTRLMTQREMDIAIAREARGLVFRAFVHAIRETGRESAETLRLKVRLDGYTDLFTKVQCGDDEAIERTRGELKKFVEENPLGNNITSVRVPITPWTAIPPVIVSARRDRIPHRKYTERESDGCVYALEYNDPQKPAQYVILWDYVEDLFKPKPSCDFVNPECIAYMDAKAKKDGNKGYRAVDHLHIMKDFPPRRGPSAYTAEQLAQEELKALQDYEVERAWTFQKERGYWPPALEAARLHLNGPYRRIRFFRPPPREYDILEGNFRGMVFTNPDNKLYFVDAELVHFDRPHKTQYCVRELGFKEMSGLPPAGRGNKVNPNEFEEAKAFFVGDAPNDVKDELRQILDNPTEWPQHKPTAAPIPR